MHVIMQRGIYNNTLRDACFKNILDKGQIGSMNLSKSQKEAICHNRGPMMVLAGPGSGKTLVITRRTKNLIEQCAVNPSKILVITFTRAAATQMKERFNKLMGGIQYPVTFGTFHSVFFTILRYAYNYNANNIIRDDVRYRFLAGMIEKYNLTIEDEKEFILGIENEISLVKGEMIDISNYYSTNCSDDIFRNIFNDYNNMLKSSRLLDFDDMLVQTYHLFKNYKNVLDSWRQKFEYILIDEFQDINRVQYEIIKLLAAPLNNLFIVGDDDQSIYRFRGAKPEIMLNFTKDYENARQVTLAANYRCSDNIVLSAKRVIKNNTKRYAKNIYTDNPPGQPLTIKEFMNVSQENEGVISEVRKMIESGTSPMEIAILYRTNTQPRGLVEKFMEYNIPFRIKEFLPCIYDHWIAGNIITYINLATAYGKSKPKETFCMDRAQFMKIANRPNRYIGRDSMSRPVVTFNELKYFYSGKTWMMERINKLEYDLEMIARMTPYSAINYIRKGMGYEEYLEDYATYRRMKVEELIDILDELGQTAKDYDTYEAWFEHIEKYKKEMEIKANQAETDREPSVTMATFHGAKGLEFENVFIIDANEGITPYHKSVKEEDIEEERRMFYVAMTRAKSRLYVYYSKERYNKELLPSRFLGEIFVDKESLKAGARINHKIYGEGTIISIDSGRLKVKFDKIAIAKLLDVDFCVSNRMINVIHGGKDV